MEYDIIMFPANHVKKSTIHKFSILQCFSYTRHLGLISDFSLMYITVHLCCFTYIMSIVLNA